MQTSDSHQAGPAAPTLPPLFHWHLEFISDGAPFVWHGQARSVNAADTYARADLSHDFAGFNRSTARRVAAAYSAVVQPCRCGEYEAKARMDDANDGGDAQHGFLSALRRLGGV